MSTSRAARMLKIDHERGTVEVGKKADLLLLSSNPIEDERAFRSVEYVVKDGVARTPSQWLQTNTKVKSNLR